MWALKRLHEKNWRVSLRVQELHHPQIFPEFLQPLWDVGTQRVAPFYLGFLFMGFWVWLAWSTTQALERCHFQFDPLFLESHYHLMLLSLVKEDELEEYVEQCLSCLEGVIEVE